MSCACGVQCERPCNAEPGSVCEDCQCRRDDEHRAELLKLQDDLLQGANREVAMETEIERLRGELVEARGFVRRVASVCGQVRQPSPQEFEALRIVARWDAPPPAESTPVQDADETKHVLGMIRNPPPPTDALKAAMARTPPAPPDDIRERLAAFEIRLAQLQAGIAALEAKGELGTHAFVCGVEGRNTDHCVDSCRCRHCDVRRDEHAKGAST